MLSSKELPKLLRLFRLFGNSLGKLALTLKKDDLNLLQVKFIFNSRLDKITLRKHVVRWTNMV